MNERAIIQNCIEALAEQRGIMEGRAEQSAKRDQYAEALEFQAIGRGLSLAMARLEEMKAETK